MLLNATLPRTYCGCYIKCVLLFLGWHVSGLYSDLHNRLCPLKSGTDKRTPLRLMRALVTGPQLLGYLFFMYKKRVDNRQNQSQHRGPFLAVIGGEAMLSQLFGPY